MFKNGSTSLKIAFPLPINIHFYRLLVDLWWKSLFDCVHSIITKVESQYFDTITDIQAYCVRQALPVKIKSLTNKLNTAIFNELSFHNKLYLSESTLFTSSRDYGLISNLDLWSLHLDSVMYFIRGALFRAIQQICSPSIRISMTHELPSFSFSFSLSLSLSLHHWKFHLALSAIAEYVVNFSGTVEMCFISTVPHRLNLLAFFEIIDDEQTQIMSNKFSLLTQFTERILTISRTVFIEISRRTEFLCYQEKSIGLSTWASNIKSYFTHETSMSVLIVLIISMLIILKVCKRSFGRCNHFKFG